MFRNDGSILNVLKIRNFRTFGLGILAFDASMASLNVSLAWLVFKLDKSSIALGFVTALWSLPILMATPVAGVMSDRFAKWKILVLCSIGQMLGALLLCALCNLPHPKLWHVYGPVLLMGIANAVEKPSRTAFIRELAGRNNLVTATSLTLALFNSSQLLGPALAGVLIASVGLPMCFFTLAVISGVSVLSLFALRVNELDSLTRPSLYVSIGVQLQEALRRAINNPNVAIALTVMATIGMFGYNFKVVIPLLARDALSVGPLELGILTSAFALGSITASIVSAMWGYPSRVFLLSSASIFSGLLALLAASRSYPLSIVLLFVVGLSGSFFMNQVASTIQLNVEDEVRGRVMSFFTLLWGGSVPFGALLTTLMTDAIGIQSAVWINATLGASGVCFALMIFARKQPSGIARGSTIA